MTPDAILAESTRRDAALDLQRDAYDPWTGTGSLIPRTSVRLVDHVLALPDEMFEDAGEDRDPAGWYRPLCTARDTGVSVKEACEALGVAFDLGAFIAHRDGFDFEWWCYSRVRIKDKDEALIPFALNVPQRVAYAERHKLRRAGGPVRYLELKFRQYGSTTVDSWEIVWLVTRVHRGQSAYMISLQSGGAAKIVARLTDGATHFAETGEPLTFAAVPNAPNSRRIEQTGGTLSIASVTSPQGASGDTLQHALISEAGKFPSTDVHSADRLFTNITSAVPPRPGTSIYIESTAEAVGVWFKEQWDKAVAGETSYHAFFLPWLVDPQYRRDPLTVRLPQIKRTAATLDEFAAVALAPTTEAGQYARTLWERGASLSQLAFYYFRLGEAFGVLGNFKQEMPSTAQEAFQYGAKPVFEPLHVAALRKTCTSPQMRGRLVGAAPTGPDSLKGIRFVPDDTGPLLVWHPPGDTWGGLLVPPGGGPGTMYERHLLATDVGGVAAGSDPHDTVVFDRAPRLFGGRSAVAAELHGRGPFYEWAWDAMRLGVWYGTAMPEREAFWVIEENSIRARLREQMGPDAFEAFLQEVRDHYTNLYLREAFNDETKTIHFKIGFQTNPKTKQAAIGDLARAMGATWARQNGEAAPEDAGYTERNAEAVQEMEHYIFDGVTMEAAPKKMDDRVMTRAIGVHVDRVTERGQMGEPRWAMPAAPRLRRAGGMASF